MINVAIVAENMAMRVGLREVINHLPGIQVIDSARASNELTAEPADVLVIVSPANLANLDDAQAVLLLTDNSADAHTLISANIVIWGLLTVNATEAELTIAILALAEGLWVGTPALTGKLLAHKPNSDVGRPDMSAPRLTEREIEVLQLAAQGLANKQIAALMSVSEHTIKFHLSSIYTKFNVSSRTEAVRDGVRRGLLVL